MNDRQRRVVLIIGGLVIAAFLASLGMVLKAFANRPHLLPIYIGAGLLTAALVIYVVIPRTKEFSCPECGRSLRVKDRIIWPASESVSGEQLQAIIERRYHCQDCNTRSLKIVTDDKQRDLTPDDKKKFARKLSKDEWDALLSEAEERASVSNQQPRKSGNWMIEETNIYGKKE